MANEFFEEDRKLGFAGANKLALERLDAVWSTTSGKLAVVSGDKVIHRLAEWASKEFGVALNSMKLAKELTASEMDDELRAVLRAVEEGEPFD